MNRREAVRRMAGAISFAVAGLDRNASAAEKPKTRMGIVSYALSIRRRLGKASSPQDDLFEPFAMLDYCHRLGAGGIQTSLGSLRPEVCQKLRSKAEAYGMFVEGIVTPPFRDEDLHRFETEIRTAAQVGARVVRTVIIPGRRYERFKTDCEFRQFARRGREALERALAVVERHRVRLAVENHKDQRLSERLALLRKLDSPYIGACVDTGNSLALLEDPLAVVEALAPFAMAVHLKDQALKEYKEGFLLADVVLGDGCLDLKKMVATLRRAKPEVKFSLETITRDPLRVPCLSERYWATFAEVPGTDLARTLRMVRAHSSDDLPQISSLPLERQAEVESAVIGRCLDYAQTELGL